MIDLFAIFRNGLSGMGQPTQRSRRRHPHRLARVRSLWRRLRQRFMRHEYLEVVHPEQFYDSSLDTGEPRDTRRKQRKRKKMAEGFLTAMRQVADDIRSDTHTARGDRRFMRHFGEAQVNLSPGMLKLLSRYGDIGFEAPFWKPELAARLEHLDATFVNEATESTRGWTLHRFRRAGLRYCRSRLPLHIPGAKWVSQVSTEAGLKGGYVTWLFFTLNEGHSWYTLRVGDDGKTIIKPCLDTGNMDHDEFYREVGWLQAAMYLRSVDRLAWKIVMQRGALRFAFQCNDAIAREMLSLRDAARGRRDAALHWVGDHDRKLSEGRKTHVRAHLRGAQEFQWEEWNCTLSPALFDQEALATQQIPEMEITERSRLITSP